MLYPKNKLPRLEEGLFENPTSEYRGTPFWAWNGKLKKETLAEQIEKMQIMGLGGFHMHVRTGMDSPYLDTEFMDNIRFCTDLAKKKNMLAWLYDEDRWPSGTAGGRVTGEHPEYAKKSLLFTTEPYAPDRPNRATKPEPGRGIESLRQDNGVLLAVYAIELNEDGTLKLARRISGDEAVDGVRWYAYMESAADDPWFNNHPYVDTLNPNAIRFFIDTTHEAYAKALQEDFGKTVPAIFTDEPQFTPKQNLSFATESRDVFLPWTDDIAEAYYAAYGEELLDILPQLVWELPDGQLSRARWRFHNLVANRFAESYCRQIGSWCDAHGIAMTGHVMSEETLESQTQAVGDAMRCYPHFGIPGIDMLCDFHQYNTAKQTQSVVRQAGKPAMLSELYGVTGWDYDFRGYKLQGDWQAVLGVTVRVPHLTWMTMKGEAKRDYPACIGYQSPWWDQFSMIENHFARLNTAMTRGKAVCHVAVVHPIESYWLYWGPSSQTAAQRNQMDERFAELTETLLFGLVDFDFICEELLPAQCPKAGAPLEVGQCRYDTVIVCGSKTLRSTTLERLEAFKKAGGKLIFIGDCPDYIDAIPSDAVLPLYESALRLPFSGTRILDALEEDRFLDVRDENGLRSAGLLYQLREDGDAKWLFVTNGVNPVCKDVDPKPNYRFILKGHYQVTVYDTLTGKTAPLAVRYEMGTTVFERTWYMHDSLLLKLEATEDAVGAVPNTAEVFKDPAIMLKPVKVTLTEPNMLLLDMAESRLDDGEWMPLEELLRVDNQARTRLGIPLRRKEVVQPYLIAPETAEHTLTLRFTIPVECAVEAPMLALEEPEQAVISLNGVRVASESVGWFVDHDIHKIALPAMPVGENILEVTVPIGRRTNLEYMYLLGDFGVRVNGVVKTVTAPVRTLGFGDVVSQGLPFYTGNIDYTWEADCADTLTVRVPHYAGGLVKLLVDGEDRGNIAFSPYALTLKGLTLGRHTLTLRLYGVRQNGFAQLHYTPGIYFYQSPNSWRSAGDMWRYEYTFKPMGILKSPELYGTGEGRHSDHITDRI